MTLKPENTKGIKNIQSEIIVGHMYLRCLLKFYIPNKRVEDFVEKNNCSWR